MSSFGLSRQLSDGSRESKLFYCYCKDCDDGDNDINNVSKFIRLGCKCIVHYVCLIQYLRYKLGDRLTMSLNGISCPYGTECMSFKTLDEVEGDDTLIYYITINDIDNIVDYGLNHNELQQYLIENDCEALTHKEVNDLREWIEFEKIRSAEIVPVNSNDITDLFVISTTKACPNCDFRSSHPHGHQCHHISPSRPPKRGGCPNCHINYCYKCLSSEIENKRDRGSDSKCKCGYWSNFCRPIQSLDDIKSYISINEGGIPFDNRCGCVICSDCRYGKSCSYCPGDCCVCNGFVNPSPNEYLSINCQERRWKAEGPSLNNGSNSSLWDCCRHGKIHQLIIIIQETNININIRDRDGRTGLHLACDANQIECIEILLNHSDIDVNLADRLGRSPLENAIQSESAAVVKLLLDHPLTDVNVSSSYRETPLYNSCSILDTTITKMLLAHRDIDINKVNREGQTSLHRACYLGGLRRLGLEFETINCLLSDHRTNVNVVDNKGMTPLSIACDGVYNVTDIVKLLLNHPDIDVNKTNGKSPLLRAYGKKNDEIFNLLLDHPTTNVSIFDCCSMGLTDHLSTLFQRNDITEKNINKRNYKGKTSLSIACSTGSIGCVELLLSSSLIEINKTNSDHSTCLHQACNQKNIEIVRILLEYSSIDVNISDSNGRTPLFISCSLGCTEIVTLLLGNKKYTIYF